MILRLCSESFLGTEAWNSNLFSGLFPGHFFYRFLNRHLDAWGSCKLFSYARYCKKQLSTEVVFYGFRLYFDCFLRPENRFWEQLFWFFLARQQIWKSLYFCWCYRSRVGRVPEGNNILFGCNQLNSRWLIAESMTDNCWKANGLQNTQHWCPWQAGSGGLMISDSWLHSSVNNLSIIR